MLTVGELKKALAGVEDYAWVHIYVGPDYKDRFSLDNLTESVIFWMEPGDSIFGIGAELPDSYFNSDHNKIGEKLRKKAKQRACHKFLLHRVFCAYRAIKEWAKEKVGPFTNEVRKELHKHSLKGIGN